MTEHAIQRHALLAVVLFDLQMFVVLLCFIITIVRQVLTNRMGDILLLLFQCHLHVQLRVYVNTKKKKTLKSF